MDAPRGGVQASRPVAKRGQWPCPSAEAPRSMAKQPAEAPRSVAKQQATFRENGVFFSILDVFFPISSASPAQAWPCLCFARDFKKIHVALHRPIDRASIFDFFVFGWTPFPHFADPGISLRENLPLAYDSKRLFSGFCFCRRPLRVSLPGPRFVFVAWFSCFLHFSLKSFVAFLSAPCFR